MGEKKKNNNTEKDIKPISAEPFPVVGIGASAGGLEALESFFSNMPDNSGLAFVIIQHLSPDYKSLMGELLSRHTQLSVQTAEEGMQVEPDHIYLIPPKKNMSIFGRRLYLTDPPERSGLNLPIDIFFRSLAQDLGKNAIAIVLSGTGSDGTLGIRAVKENGGMVFAQDDSSAKFDGMPRSSIATGMVDVIASAEEMPKALIRYIQHPFISRAEQKKEKASDENLLLRILKVIRDRTGVDFTYYKQNTILRRLEKRIGINQLSDYKDYLSFLENSTNEAEILYKDLLIGVTQFFRDKEAYDILKNELLTKILKDKAPGDQARVWVAGCSTGEEAYSIAILFLEYMAENNLELDVKIFATDLDKEHITIAGNGIYPDSIIADVTQERLKKHFIKKEKGYLVNDTVRRMVIFAQQNIIKDPPFSKIDLISCRNMLIYLNQDVQRRIISMFYQSLVNGGGLFLGSSETLGDISGGFAVLHTKWKIYLQKTGFTPPHTANYLMPQSKIRVTGPPIHDRTDPRTPKHGLPDNILTSLLDEVMPPSVIVDENLRLVHVFNEVNAFLRVPSGRASHDILSMVRQEISVVLSSMLNKSLKDNKESIFKDIKLKDDKVVNISTTPIIDKYSKNKFIVITFEESSTEKKADLTDISEEFDMNQQLTQRYIELEKDLQFTKENLQATIEELETSNEELQSTNEELIASNEELQSTNEELQSVNEELYTVNTEYQQKIEELTQLNNDMNNLLKNTSIGILYLDKKLRIRKYTTMITRVINIMEMDIGRPIQHLSLNVPYEDFIGDIEFVLDTLQEKEIELQDKSGHWNLIRILPYRTQENAIDGITVTIIDISNLKKSREKYEYLFSSMTQGVVYQDRKGNIIEANKAAEVVLGLTRDQLMGKTSFDPGWKATHEDGRDFPGKDHPSMIALKTGKIVKDTVMGVYHPRKDKTVWISITAIPQYHPGDEVPYQVFTTFDDITGKKEREDEIIRQNNLLYSILDNSPVGKMVLDEQGRITYANKRSEEITGIPADEIITRTFNDLEWKISGPEGEEIPQDKLPYNIIMLGNKEIRDYVMRIEGPGSKPIMIKVNGAPMPGKDDIATGAIFSIERIKARGEKTNTWKDY